MLSHYIYALVRCSNVDTFAEKVKADKLLANGFNCVGLSQGNNICRGYLQVGERAVSSEQSTDRYGQMWTRQD